MVVAGAVDVLAVVALVEAGAVLAVVLAVVEVLAAEVREAVGDKRLGHKWKRTTTNPSQMPASCFDCLPIGVIRSSVALVLPDNLLVSVHTKIYG